MISPYALQYQSAPISTLSIHDGYRPGFFDRINLGFRHAVGIDRPGSVPPIVCAFASPPEFTPYFGASAVGRNCFNVEGPFVANSAKRGLVDQNLGIEYVLRKWPLNHGDLVVFAGSWRGQNAIVRFEPEFGEIYIAPLHATGADLAELAYEIVIAEVTEANEIAATAAAHYVSELKLPDDFIAR